MTKEQKDKILKALAEDRNNYARDCQERIEREYGKIEGADYMLQRFLDVLKTEDEILEKEVNTDEPPRYSDFLKAYAESEVTPDGDSD